MPHVTIFVKMAQNYSKSTPNNIWKHFSITLFYETFLVKQIFNICCHCGLFDQVLAPFRGSCCVKLAKNNSNQHSPAEQNWDLRIHSCPFVRPVWISESVHRFVLASCTKLQDNKGTEVTFSDFSKKTCFRHSGAKTVKNSPFWPKNGHFDQCLQIRS